MAQRSARWRRLVAGVAISSLALGAGTLVVTQTALATQPMTATTYVNMRSGPATTYPVLRVLSPGLAVEASGAVANGWAKVTVGGQTGWVYRTYLKASASAPAASAPATTGATTGGTAPKASGSATTTAGVNVRTGPDTTYPVVATLASGTKVDTTGAVSGNWTQVLYNGAVRWMYSSYLAVDASTPATPAPAPTSTATTPAAAPSTAPTTTTAPTPTPSTPTRQIRTVANLYLRTGGSLNDPYTGILPGNSIVDITGRTTTDYTEIVYQGQNRWIATRYTTAVPTTSPAVPTATSLSLTIPKSITTSGISQLTPNAKSVVSAVLARYPRITTLYGWRSSSAYSSDHPNGRAVDIMMPSPWSANADYGWEIAKYFAANASTYHVKYVIYRQSIFTIAYPERGWRPMENRGSATANHYDHVHVSVYS